jgi:hypothetical protein
MASAPPALGTAIPGNPSALHGAAAELERIAGKLSELGHDVRSVAAAAKERARWAGAAAERYSAHHRAVSRPDRLHARASPQDRGRCPYLRLGLSSAQGQQQDAHSKASAAAALPAGAQHAAMQEAQSSAAAATGLAQQAASTAASAISGAIAALPKFGPPAEPKGHQGESGINVMDEIDKLNRMLGYPLLPSAIASLGFEANAVFQAWQAGKAISAVPGEAAAWFAELVGPTGLAFDRGQATLADFAGPLARWQTRLDAAEAFTKQGADEAANLLGEGGIREGGALDAAGKFFGGVAIISDALTVINPGESGARGTVTRVVAGVNGVTTLAAMTGTLAAVGGIDASVGWVPVAGQVVIVGTGLYLAGDWAYNNIKPFHDFVNTAASDTVSVAKTAWHGLSDGVSAVGHFFGL